MLGGSNPAGARLDVSVRLQSGTPSNYLVPGAIERDGDRTSLDVSRSRATMVVLYIGVAVPAR